MHRRAFLSSSAAAAVAALTACATGPRTLEVPLEQLQAALARRFPMTERFMGLLDVQASAPRLQLRPQANRLAVDVALAASARPMPGSVRGAIAFSFAPRYVAADSSLRMGGVVVERLDLEGLPQAMQRELLRLGPFLAERMLEDVALHTFSADDIARLRGWTPTEVRVTPGGVQVVLHPPG